MSKTITIPKDRDPFVVIVNGVEYKYAAGETVTVPDSVADVIEKYENAKPKPDPNPAPGGSVQSDWNQTDSSAADFIKNKPFGETYGDTVTVKQIDPNNFDTSTLVGEMFMKISDVTVTVEDLSNGFSIYADGQSIDIPAEGVSELVYQFADGLTAISDIFISVEEQAVGVDSEGFAFPESGLYVQCYLAIENSVSLTVPGFRKFLGIKELDEKYIPGKYKNVQADWKQTDETSADYIKNKPDFDVIEFGRWDNSHFSLWNNETMQHEVVTNEKMESLIERYDISRMRFYDCPVVWAGWVNNNSYYGIAAVTPRTTSNSGVTLGFEVLYTAEYTET